MSNLDVFIAATLGALEKEAASPEKKRRKGFRKFMTAAGGVAGGVLGQMSHRKNVAKHVQGIKNMATDNPKWITRSTDVMQRPRGYGIRRTVGGALLGSLAGNLASRALGQ